MDKLKTIQSEIFVAVICVLVIIIFVMFVNNKNYNSELYDQYIQGLWIADEDFCKRSDIDEMMVYVGPLVESYRKAFLMMYSGDKVMVAKQFQIEAEDDNILQQFKISDIMKKNITLSDDSEDAIMNIYIADVMPEDLIMEMSIKEGRMTWMSDDETVYANLYKKHDQPAES